MLKNGVTEFQLQKQIVGQTPDNSLFLIRTRYGEHKPLDIVPDICFSLSQERYTATVPGSLSAP